MALRQQVYVLQRSVKRPHLKPRDRIFWVWLARVWNNWRSCLMIVQPDTVIRWHRQGFRLFWRWRSTRRKFGRPRLDKQVRDLIGQMSRENPTWGAPRIQAELKLLGHAVAEQTVSRYMVQSDKPPSQTWRTFLKNHAADLAGIDFFTVPTATFRILYVFVLLHHGSRRVLHFNITDEPTARWTAQQIVEAVGYDEAPDYLLRDRDSVYGEYFRSRVEDMGIQEVLTAYQSPWQNPYVERLIGSIRRECLNHVIIFDENHLRRMLTSYFSYYHHVRPHQSLGWNSPFPRKVEPPEVGEVTSIPQVGGLHHLYIRSQEKLDK